jgi:hypothetical protein
MCLCLQGLQQQQHQQWQQSLRNPSGLLPLLLLLLLLLLRVVVCLRPRSQLSRSVRLGAQQQQHSQAD